MAIVIMWLSGILLGASGMYLWTIWRERTPNKFGKSMRAIDLTYRHRIAIMHTLRYHKDPRLWASSMQVDFSAHHAAIIRGEDPIMLYPARARSTLFKALYPQGKDFLQWARINRRDAVRDYLVYRRVRERLLGVE